jgi:hypothetical protein
MNSPATIPFTRRLDREPRIEEMAKALIRAHNEAGLDLDDWGLVDRWLNAAMYSQGQILAFGDAALSRASARVKRTDDIACTAGVIAAVAALFFGWIGYAGEAHAAILSPAGLDAGGDVWLVIVSLIVGLYVGHKIGWLQYGRKLRIVAPDPDDEFTMEQNARRMQR